LPCFCWAEFEWNGQCSIASENWQLKGSNAGQSAFLGSGLRNDQERQIYVTKH
jgi:hypothetical protein